MAAILNGFRCNPATAEWIITHPGGNDIMGQWHTLDEDLYQAPEGNWFTVRALTPEDARDWLELQGDEVMLQRRFPDDE